MSMAALRYLALNLGAAMVASARPAATLLAVQLVVVVLLHHEMAAVPPAYDWLVATPAIAVVALFAVVETIAKHDTDIAAIVRELKIDNITGAFGATAAVLLFSALGLPEAQLAAVGEGGVEAMGQSGVLEATADAATTEMEAWMQATVVIAAVALNLGMTWLRSEALAFAHDYSAGKLWARVETGGVVALLILLPLFPLVAFAFVVLFAVGLAVMAMAVRTARRVIDEQRRVGCEGCDYRVRVEASVCPQCGTEREPSELLASGPLAVLRGAPGREEHRAAER